MNVMDASFAISGVLLLVVWLQVVGRSGLYFRAIILGWSTKYIIYIGRRLRDGILSNGT